MPLCNGYAMITQIIPTGSHYYMVALLCHNGFYRTFISFSFGGKDSIQLESISETCTSIF